MKGLLAAVPMAVIVVFAFLGGTPEPQRRPVRRVGVADEVPREPLPSPPPSRPAVDEPPRMPAEQPGLPASTPIERLLEKAASDPVPWVREAALRELPVGLDASQTGRISACLLDPDAAIALAAVRVMRAARAIDAAALQGLRELAFGSRVSGELRAEARRALVRLAESLPPEDLAALGMGPGP